MRSLNRFWGSVCVLTALGICGGCSDDGVPIIDNPPPPGGCSEGTKRDCDMGGATGEQICTAGAWGVCREKPCTDGATLPCTQADGKAGQKVCSGGAWTACGPVPGQCQEGTFIACTAADNAPGKKQCTGGTWGPCVPDEKPDCNDGDKQACTTACGVGTEICVKGAWQNCDAPKPAQEICDGYDNNCDGQVDEVCGCVHGQCEVCYTGPEETLGVGTCKVGQRCCVSGQWAPCANEVLPAAADDCGDALDNDCDGTINNGCVCTLGTQQACGTDVGECSVGLQTCQTIGSEPGWGDCLNSVGPLAEGPLGCDGKDNDCDGTVDNNLSPDADEANDSCSQARQKSLDDDGKTLTVGATLYPTGDVDYFRLTLNEVSTILLPKPCNPICLPGKCDPQCLYLDVEIVQPAGAIYEATVLTGSSCGAPSNSFPTTSKLTIHWDGECGWNDSNEVWLKVERKGGSLPEPVCQPYQLKLRMTKENDSCPAS